ncbi:MAG TPA: hypothetical protein VFH68_15535 [Polyangia bacterium]|nr:hypothetical protein [Polyangia bacterium]
MPRARLALPLVRCLPALVSLASAANFAAGCASEGSYQVRWSFGDPGLLNFTAEHCGQHGVSAIAMAGRRDDGKVDNPVAACAPGVFAHQLPTGVWTLELTALDATGHSKTDDPDYLRGSITITVAEDQLAGTDQGPVVLLPLPACRDGVDNDCDGRVDLDDPGCAEEETGTTEQGADLSVDPQPPRAPGAPSACTP